MHVQLRVGEEGYAIPVDDVLAVLDLEGVSPLLGAPPSVLGLRALRGELVPVFDLAVALGAANGAPHRIIVVGYAGARVGFAVDEVLDVAALPDADEAPDAPHLRGAVLVDGGLVGVIDVAAVLAALEAELVT